MLRGKRLCAPGSEFQLKVLFSAPREPGQFRKRILLKSEDGELVSIFFSGDCSPLLSVSPERINVAKCKAGDEVRFKVWSEFYSIKDIQISSDFIDESDVATSNEHRVWNVVAKVKSDATQLSFLSISAVSNGERSSHAVELLRNSLVVLPRTLAAVEGERNVRFIVVGDFGFLEKFNGEGWYLADSATGKVNLKVDAQSEKAVKLSGEWEEIKNSLVVPPIHLFNTSNKIVEIYLN